MCTVNRLCTGGRTELDLAQIRCSRSCTGTPVKIDELIKVARFNAKTKIGQGAYPSAGWGPGWQKRRIEALLQHAKSTGGSLSCPTAGSRG